LDDASIAGPVPDGVWVTFIANSVRISSYKHLNLSRGNGSLEYEVVHTVKDELFLDELLGGNVLLESAAESHFSKLVAGEVFFPCNEQLVNSLIWVVDVNVDEVPTVVTIIATDRNLFDCVLLNILVHNRVFSINGQTSINIILVVSLPGLLIHNRSITFNHCQPDGHIFVFPVVELEDLMVVSFGFSGDIWESVELDLQGLSYIYPLQLMETTVFLCQHERIVTDFTEFDTDHYYDTCRSVVALLCPE